MTKVWYGFRFFGGRGTTWADTYRIAGELVAYTKKRDLEEWLSREALTEPHGLGGGERIAVSRKEAVKLVGVAFVRDARDDALGGR